MKTLFKIFILIGGIILASCEKDFLDKAPESGLTEEVVFSKYENFMSYFDGIQGGKYYDFSRPTGDGKNWGDFNIQVAYPMRYQIGNQKTSWVTMTETADAARGATSLAFKLGNYSQYNFIYTYANYVPILRGSFMVIRRANMALEKIDMLQDASQVEIDDIKGQAYFYRALANFALLRTWGPMPYVEDVVGGEDSWDRERLSKYEYLTRIAADWDTAAIYFEKANLMRRDNPAPGSPGHLNHPEMFRPNGCAAMAFRGRALLYAASPLNNGGITGQPWEKGIGEGQQAWEKAAIANWEALETTLQFGYTLLTPENYQYNFVGSKYTNEHLFAWLPNNGNPVGYNSNQRQWIINGPMSANKSANNPTCPTQNGVDKFETKWGDPLNTEADRQAAAALGHYNEQDPYKDRDPRFYQNVMHNTMPIPGYGTAKIYYELINGVPKYSEQLDHSFAGWSRTGYYLTKGWGGQSTKNRINVTQTDPLMRLAELYLNYAEAANEAYGPNAPAPGANLTAVEAINIIRDRFEMPPVDVRYTGNKDDFRERIKNERFVELGYETFHYFFDNRRWMDAPKTLSGGVYGIDIEKLPAGYDNSLYPTGYRYTRVLMPNDRQPVWRDEMYYFAFDLEDIQKMNNFKPNLTW